MHEATINSEQGGFAKSINGVADYSTRSRPVDAEQIKTVATGRWHDILPRFGFSSEILDGRHHPCPRCGGTDRFRLIDDDAGAVLCNQCFCEGNGDGLAAVRWLNGWDFPETVRQVADYLNVSATATFDQPMQLVEETTFDYRDETGDLLYQAVRRDYSDGSKDFLQRQPVPGGDWNYKTRGVRRVLYRLPELLADKESTVFLVEGERKAESLRTWGFLATCNVGGAGKWDPSYSETLRNRNVVILPDNDEAGAKHADKICEALADVAKSIRVLTLPDLPPKGDIVDWIAAGHTRDEFEALLATARVIDANGWPEIIPLTTSDVPSFPTSCLPFLLARFVEEVAEATQTPPDLAGTMLLAVAATAAQGKYVVSPCPGWKEPVSLVLASFMDPANRKSEVVRRMAMPIREYEKEQAKRMAGMIRESLTKADLLQKRRSKAMDDCAKLYGIDAEPAEERLRNIEAEIEAHRIITEPQLLADDITPEALSNRMVRNHGRMGVLTAEGDLFEIFAGRYSQNPNIGIFLRGHAGDEHRIDRNNGRSERISRPALTIGCCVQPAVMRDLLSKPDFRGKGFLGRILYTIPESLLGRRKIETREVSEVYETAYTTAIRQLLESYAPTDEDDEYIPNILKFSPSALTSFREFQAEVEAQLADEGEFCQIRDWAGKLCGAVARIAGLLHLLQTTYTRPDDVDVIDSETVANAVLLGRYFTAHAVVCLQVMGAGRETQLAGSVLSAIKRNSLTEFSRRDLHRILQRQVDGAEELDSPLMLLMAHGYLRKMEQSRKEGKAGRKPTEKYEVNPCFCSA